MTIPPALGALERFIVPRMGNVSLIYVNQIILKNYAEILSVTNSIYLHQKSKTYLNCLFCFYSGGPDFEIT